MLQAFGFQPVEPTASGRLYMAFAPQLLAGNPGATRVSAAAVKRAHARGYDVNEAEWLPGLTAKGLALAPATAVLRKRNGWD